MCRAALPPGSPDQALAVASGTFLRMKRRVDRGLAAWGQLRPQERDEMTQVVAVWAEASEQGLEVITTVHRPPPSSRSSRQEPGRGR